MATLQKIRNHGALLLIIVGLAMLAFILGDFLNSGSSFFNRGRENVATIAGHDVHYTAYQAAQDQLTEVYKIETGRNDLDEDQHAQLRNQVWQMMLMDYSLRAEAKKIGMDITADELSDLCIGNNIHQIIRGRRAFYDQTGQFNRAALVQFLASLEKEPESAEQAANIKQAKQYWMYWENAVRLTYMQEKYTTLLQNMVRANSLDAEYAFAARENSANVSYVVKPYYQVADSLVKVSDSDLKKVYGERKEMFKQTPNRAIAYITFPVVPSEQDFADAENLMKSLEEEFNTTDDIALVVNMNSDVMYDGRDYSEETVPAQYKEFAFGKDAKAGKTTGLLFENGTYSMARIMQAGYSMPDSVELKLIATAEGQEDAELGWFKATDLTKEIAEKAFAGKRGTRFTVAAGLGEQTFEVLDIAKATPKVKLAILEREVSASSKTYSILYNQAKQFVVNNPNEDAFVAGAQELGKTVMPQYNMLATTEKVADLKSSRAIVRWAFEAKEGQVSDVFECGDQFVVAALTEVNEGDYRPLEAVRGELTMEATNRKKAEYIKKQLKGVTSIEAAAEALGVAAQVAENVNFSGSRFGNGGMEPKVVGAAWALDVNEMSAPIAGNMGVYVIMPTSKTATGAELNAEQEKQQLGARAAYSLPYQAISLIQEEANVVDNRANFQ